MTPATTAIKPIPTVHRLGDLSGVDHQGLQRDADGFWTREGYGKADVDVTAAVYHRDEYKLEWLDADAVPPGGLIVDVGAHIGAFARKAHEKWPTARIVCVEPVAANVAVLRANVGDHATVVHAACTYETDAVLYDCVQPGVESTGGSMVRPADDVEPKLQGKYVYHRDHRPLATVTLEDLRTLAGDGTAAERIDLLKLDCEESEFSILGRSPSLDHVERIVGEFHGEARWNDFRAARFPAGPDGWTYHWLGADGNAYCGLFHLTRNHGRKRTPRRELPWIGVPGGIGDVLWAFTKLPALLAEYGVAQCHVGVHDAGAARRSFPFIERFDFVAAVQESPWVVNKGAHPWGGWR
ncbi:MAG: FkbM family methyltransferase, partial [Planctomycetia bacterium]